AAFPLFSRAALKRFAKAVFRCCLSMHRRYGREGRRFESFAFNKLKVRLSIPTPSKTAMPKSLLEELPGIVREGRQQAERILEGLESRHRVRLQTREWVLPSKDVSAADWVAQAQRAARLGEAQDDDWRNRLIYG